MKSPLHCKLSVERWTLSVCSLLLLTFASCSHLTVAPKPTEARSIAMGETNKPDADVIDGNASGLLVRKAWLDSYFALETKFKETIPADRLIKPEGDTNYRVPYPVSDHRADLKRRERLAAAGP
jgi:hypothetical protein